MSDVDMVQTRDPANNQIFYLTTALFKTMDAAFYAAERFYQHHGEEYDWKCVNGIWSWQLGTTKNNTATLLSGTIESQVMEFI